ncbi:MAG: hypothetical protein AVDCRST_MAG70-542 [uncultured Thermomicrobiales bacterium]|uniref:Uncharacterized protein n=1 Tax=uncultured Thermomicrobiales bacterium TaxID=1645740 RepID=A0A6J4UG39_9BACT|nr:MAG: hypothetical protein AVDCRST_MAG70-542 [uncultured Thermomicrobiales bacterium]
MMVPGSRSLNRLSGYPLPRPQRIRAVRPGPHAILPPLAAPLADLMTCPAIGPIGPSGRRVIM